MSVRRAAVMLGATCLLVAIGYLVLTATPSATAGLIADTERFCQSIEAKDSEADLYRRASAVHDRAVNIEKVEPQLLLVRISVCHCYVRFTGGAAAPGKVSCNG